VKPKLIAPVLGLAMLIPALADAATAPNPKTSQPVRLTQEMFQYSVSGTPPLGGSNSYVGTSDGRIGSFSVHATVRGTNTYRSGGNFDGKDTIFAPGGSIRITFKATTVFNGRFAGRGRFTGGTGQYRGATGYFTFTADEQNPTTFARTLSGWISTR
jgi:hypothetical protein